MKTDRERLAICRFCSSYETALRALGYVITLSYDNDKEKIFAVAFEGSHYEKNLAINVGASSTTAVARDVCNQIVDFLKDIA